MVKVFKFLYHLMLLLVLNFYTTISGNDLSSSTDFGLDLGSLATTKLIKNYAQNVLRQPRKLQFEVQTSQSPWFDPIGHIDTRNHLALGDMAVRFRDNQIEAVMENVRLNSSSDLYLLTLPFLLGGDLRISALIKRAVLRFKLDPDVQLDECDISVEHLDVHLDKAYFVNLLLRAVQDFVPKSMVRDYICPLLAEGLVSLRRKFTLEIPFASLIPEKFVSHLLSPNILLYSRLQSVVAEDDQLIVTASIDWIDSTVSNEAPSFFGQMRTNLLGEAGEDLALAKGFPLPDRNLSSIDPNRGKFKLAERLHLWVEDRLLNELFQRFRWDFQWVQERIPLNSPKLPNETREFLTTLCIDCFFLFNITANEIPSVEVRNSSIVVKNSNRISVAIENPHYSSGTVQMNRTKKAIDLSLTLTVEFTPQIENGIFRTHLNLLDREIKIQNGSAFPKFLNQPIAQLLKDMIAEDIWPAVQKELDPLIYSEGVQIPRHCGIEPSSAQLFFQQDRIGVSASLDLDQVSFGHCLQQLRSKLPDPTKLFVIKTTDQSR